MNENSRTTNVIQNSVTGILVQAGNILLNFLVRIVFVKFLSQEYLGVNGLFSNILTILSLAELGVGGAITYSLYKPVAEKNYTEIAALLNFYKKAYAVIGCVVAVLGVAILPCLPVLVDNSAGISHLRWIYLLFLANTVSTYFFAHKRAIFTADQRENVLSRVKFYYAVIKAAGQCLILWLTHNYLLFLSIQILCSICENIFVSVRANREYPFLIEYKSARLSKKTVSEITQNVKSLVIYKVGGVLLDGTDNIILTICVGLAWVGKLSNYTLIIGSVSMIITQLMSSLTASVGNFIAKENSERYEELLDRITFISFIFYGFSFVCLSCLTTPFVKLLFGTDYTLNTAEAFIIALNFYIFGMMNPVWTFRTTMGLFVHGKYRPLISAILNVVISILLAKLIGPIGVLLGTTITRTLTNVWFDPYIVYKHGLKKTPLPYYLKWIGYLVFSILVAGIASLICSYTAFIANDLAALLAKVLACVLIFGGITVCCFRHTEEFHYFSQMAKTYLRKKNPVQ